MANLCWLCFLPTHKARHLHHNPDQHDGPRLRGFARQGHNPGENPFSTLTGDHFIDVRDIGVNVPWDIVDSAASQARNSRDQQQQSVNIAKPCVIEHRVGD
ncbi:hypothetical protein D3C72_1577170 [compost metagenome]